MPSEERNAPLKPSSTPGKGVVVIIGSGFGGSVVARRLAQANRYLPEKLQIVLLERGRRYEPQDFPRLQLPERLTEDPALRSSKRLPDAARLWWTYDQGLWQIRDLRGLRVALAAGYGGGSLIYASVHLRPPDSVFETWPMAYRRKTLDPYYQLVEAMLDARPSPPTWTKTIRMDSVAKDLKRQQFFFHPPLALTFGDSRTSTNTTDESHDNGFGVQQRSCIGCGDCIIGCQHRAKNTLDLNYLAGIEEGEFGVRVRTLAEAIAIDSVSDEAGNRFRVRYRDHLRGGQEDALCARYVFVCAGAVGSTELLLSSKRGLAESPTGLDCLGNRFFANGDAAGVIFDTAERWEPSAGPTITTSFYHRENKDWFLLQEGGIPPTLQRGLGFMQSQLWLGRNAFGTASRSAPDPKPSQGQDGLREFIEKLVTQPGMRSMTAPKANSSLLPKSIEELLASIEPPGLKLRNQLKDIDHGVVDRLIKRYQSRCWWWIPDWLIALPIRWVGYGNDLPAATLKDLVARFAGLSVVRDSRSALALGIQSLIELLLGPPPTEHTAILLAMGPDSQWKLDWSVPKGQMFATGDTAANVILYGLQEQLMRDVAHSLDGELRTNPTWTLGHHPVTVHAQGGCSMSTDQEKGVTDPNGLMVRGIDGLYVFDGSVFPDSVGVNPSSTIASVAERNIEAFIRRTLGLGDWSAALEEAKRAPDFAAQMAAKQNQWDQGPGKILDNPPQPNPAKARAPGLRWDEVMEGFLGDPLQNPPALLLPPEELEAARFRDLEREGQKHLRHIRADLKATIDNLEESLLTQTPRFIIDGELQVSWSVAQKRDRYTVSKGSLDIDLTARNGVGSMRYEIKATSKSNGRDQLILEGVKLLHEDPGMDVWKDLTTLYVVVTRERKTPEKYAGIIRVPLIEFIRKQLPSMDVVGDDISPMRKSWLILRFIQKFYRGLAHIYPIGEL